MSGGHLEYSSVTQRLDAAIDRTGQDDETTDAVVAAGRSLVADGDEEW